MDFEKESSLSRNSMSTESRPAPFLNPLFPPRKVETSDSGSSSIAKARQESGRQLHSPNGSPRQSCPVSPNGSYPSPLASPPIGYRDAITSISVLISKHQVPPQQTKEVKPKKSSTKMDKLYDGSQHIRKCGDCFSTTSSSHWNTDPFVVGGHLCQRCYRRRRRFSPEELRRKNVPPMRSCRICNKSDQTSIWFKHTFIPYCFTCDRCNSILKSTTSPGSALKLVGTTQEIVSKHIKQSRPYINSSASPKTGSSSYQGQNFGAKLSSSSIDRSVKEGNQKFTLPGIICLRYSIRAGYEHSAKSGKQEIKFNLVCFFPLTYSFNRMLQREQTRQNLLALT
jgi:hypothetical protein